MAEPGVVQAVRGGVAESRHLVHAVVCRADGTVVASAGDPAHVTYLRSAAKPFQAIPAIVDGVVEAFGLEDRHVAVACGSHAGAPMHAAAVAELLERADVPLSALRVRGLHPPLGPDAARALARAGRLPGPLEHNCSGNHALMLAHARARGLDLDGYLDPEGVLQREAGDVAETVCGALARSVDRCGMGAYALALRGMATGYARLAADALPEPLAAAGRRVREAMAGEPDHVAGPGMVDTLTLRMDGMVAKSGAAGVFCCASAGTGLGGALKVVDGDALAARLCAAALVEAVAGVRDPALAALADRAVLDGEGGRVGRYEVELALA